MKIFWLTPLSGYKTNLRSDTLWGVICWGIRLLYGEKKLEDFLKACSEGNPPFVISSPFPFKQIGEEQIPFFPKPILPVDSDSENESEEVLTEYRLRKRVKKMTMVNLTDFNKVLNGALTHKDFKSFAEERLKFKNSGKDVLPEHLVKQSPPAKQILSVTHNTIDRIKLSTLEKDGSGQLFHTDETYWEGGQDENHKPVRTGIFFLVRGETEMLEAVMRYYRHTGFGGDRSTGKGFFDIQVNDFHKLKEPADANAMVNLSLFRPKESELEAIEAESEKCFYLLERRSGRVGFLLVNREKPAQMYFKEGSVFPLMNQTVFGGLSQHNLSVGHPIYQNGFGFMVRMKL